jgi:hypothetical protein
MILMSRTGLPLGRSLLQFDLHSHARGRILHGDIHEPARGREQAEDSVSGRRDNRGDG